MIVSFLFITSSKRFNLRQISPPLSLLCRVLSSLSDLLKAKLSTIKTFKSFNFQKFKFLNFSLGFARLFQKGNSNLERYGKELKTPCTKETDKQVFTSISHQDIGY